MLLIPFKTDRGNKLLDSDTDSIVTAKPIDSKYVSSTELGKFKLVDEIILGYFISDKLYAYINAKGDIIKKSKGINNNLLNLEDYKTLNDVISITKNQQYTKKI